ncbi:CpaF family protein [Actinomadura sp. 6N118]|uniref:CpaF family protein n=1 Tax=Actinomadura sp. 6N118 TaxID=3375151 RepID=UPI00379AB6A2
MAAEVQRRIVERLTPDGLTPSAHMQERLVAAVLDELFGLGPLQVLLKDPTVENIDINGCDQVWVDYADGRREAGPAAAATDEELIEKVRLWSRQGSTAREFSVAIPLLNTALQEAEGARLSASMSVTPRPYASIRCHRLVDIGMDDLLSRGTVDHGLAAFFAAAVRARKNIVVTGGTSSGKTTFVRALTACIDPAERIATLESDFELFLHRLPHRHRDVIAFEARQANSEGHGSLTLHDLIPQCLRHNPRRIIVGEVRSTEILPMLEAMQSGHEGSFCTLHANSGEDAFNRILVLALRGGVAMPTHAIHLMVGMSIDLVVHIRRAGATRFVSQVLEVLPPADTDRPAVNHVYNPGPDGRAVPGTTPQCLPDLIDAGFDASVLGYRNGLWAGAS